MKLYYTSSISFPSPHVNRLQTLNTAEALKAQLGDNFALGAYSVDTDNGIYTGQLTNFHTKNSFILGWRQLAYIRKHDFGVVYSREQAILWSMMIYNMLFFRKKLMFVLEMHDIPHDFRLGFVLRRCTYIFCVTSGLKYDIDQKFPNNTSYVLRNGVDLKRNTVSKDMLTLRKQFGLPIGSDIVTYVGGIGTHSWKGEDVFLDARRYATDLNTHFVIAGIQEKERASFIARYGLTDNTTYIGRLNAEQVAEIQAVSDVLVLPNKRGDIVSERYTCPIKMFEYMRSGTPIVTSDLPSIREVLDDSSAFFAEPDNPESLAHIIEFALANPEVADQKARKARTEVEQYTWEKKADVIIKYLNENI